MKVMLIIALLVVSACSASTREVEQIIRDKTEGIYAADARLGGLWHVRSVACVREQQVFVCNIETFTGYDTLSRTVKATCDMQQCVWRPE